MQSRTAFPVRQPGDGGLCTGGLPDRFTGGRVRRLRALVGFDGRADQPDGENGGGKEQHNSNGHSDQRPPYHAPCLFRLAILCLLPLRQRLGSVGLRCFYLFKLLALGVLPSRLGFLARPNELVV